MKADITIKIDTDALEGYTDQYITTLWHVTQANPAPIDDPHAGQLAEHVGREIIRRFITNVGPELWNHQGRHHESCKLTDLRQAGKDLLEAATEAQRCFDAAEIEGLTEALEGVRGTEAGDRLVDLVERRLLYVPSLLATGIAKASEA